MLLDASSLVYFFMIVVGLPVTGLFSIPIVLIVTHHKRKMEELRQRKGTRMAEDIRAEFASLRAELQALRDTTTQYDLSFDSALHQLERRMEHIEQRTLLRPTEEPPQIIEMNRR